MVEARCGLWGRIRDALEGKGLQRWPQRRLDRHLEEVVKAVGGGYCRLQMPLQLALGVRETVAGHRLGALEEGGEGTSPPSNASLGRMAQRGPLAACGTKMYNACAARRRTSAAAECPSRLFLPGPSLLPSRGQGRA